MRGYAQHVRKNGNSGTRASDETFRRSENMKRFNMIMNKLANWFLPIVIAVVIISFVIAAIIPSFYRGSSGNSDSGTSHQCFVCGKRAYSQVGGVYYCHKHYNWRLFEAEG